MTMVRTDNLDIYNKDDMQEAVDESAQEMFESCVKMSCEMCNKGYAIEKDKIVFCHPYLAFEKFPRRVYCQASTFRNAYPDRSERMNTAPPKN